MLLCGWLLRRVRGGQSGMGMGTLWLVRSSPASALLRSVGGGDYDENLCLVRSFCASSGRVRMLRGMKRERDSESRLALVSS